jgi:N-acetylglucosamine-6-phosphate deacetylase
MIILDGADLILPDRILDRGRLVLDAARIVEISESRGGLAAGPGAERRELHGCLIAPGFIDVHVHGILGVDSLDGDGAIGTIAAALPRFGVTAFCPTTVACEPEALGRVLAAIGRDRTSPSPTAARILPGHLESNFINPAFAGAQPLSCLRLPPRAGRDPEAPFSGEAILAEIERRPADVGIITMAPELAGGLELVARFVRAGHRVSLGHSGATYDEAMAAVRAGARQATHLFNRMTPLGHREPGLPGAVLCADEIAAEVIGDGVHVHPAVIRAVVSAKQPSRVMAITDGTAGSGMPRGSRAKLGGRPITVREAAYLDDGTLAGSVATMDRVFACLTGSVGLSPVDAALLCATTPARELGLDGHGYLARDAVADLVVLDRRMQVVETYIGGRRVYERSQD